jgi:hypothetical protein
MMRSRDVTLVILFAVLNFVFAVSIGAIFGLYSTLFISINNSVAWLLFGGRRWRIFALGLLFNLLLFSVGYPPTGAMAGIVNSFILDAVFNSFYGSFKKESKLVWWILVAQVFSLTTGPLWILVFSVPFFPMEEVIANWFVPLISLTLPVMMVENLVGSYIGYRIFKKVEKIT